MIPDRAGDTESAHGAIIPKPVTPHQVWASLEGWPAREHVRPGVWSVVAGFKKFLTTNQGNLRLNGTPPCLPGPAVEAGSRPVVEVYVDEIGDLGFSAESSPWFGIGAVMVPQESAGIAAAIVCYLQSTLSNGAPLHWVRHFAPRKVDHREAAARLVAMIPGAKVIYVIADKTSAQVRVRRNRGARLYRHAVRVLLEAAATAASRWDGGPRVASVALESIGTIDPAESTDFVNSYRSQHGFPWDHINWPPIWCEPEECTGVQLADLYMGMLGGSFDAGLDSPLLFHYRHQLWRGPNDRLVGFGVKPLGSASFLAQLPWLGKLNVMT